MIKKIIKKYPNEIPLLPSIKFAPFIRTKKQNKTKKKVKIII